MRKPFLLTPGIFVLTAMLWAQVPTAAAPAPDRPLPGTVLSVELSMKLDVRKCRANDKIEARTVADLLVHGQIVVPRNSEIIGHITEARAHSRLVPGSKVGITFDRLLVKDGREIPLQMMVQAIARPLPPAAGGGGPDSYGDASAIPQMPRGGVLTPARPATMHGVTPVSPSHVHEPPSSKNPGTANSNPNALDSTSRGVFGINGLALDSSGPVSVLSSSKGNVKLESGTQFALRVE
jgi:hypothetical protein